MWKTVLGLVLVGLMMICGLHAQDAAQSGLRDEDAAPSSATSTPEATEPKGEASATAETKAPGPEATPASTPLPEPPAVENKTPSPNIPDLSQLDEAFKQTSLGKAADEFRTRVEWRKLKNEMANDPEVEEAKKAADHARTDLERRERLRDYYEIYYRKMKARASTSELRSALETFKTDHLRLLAQPRVRPNSDLPSETPTPTPKGAKKSHKKIPGTMTKL